MSPLKFTYPYKLPPGFRRQSPPDAPMYPLLQIKLYKEGDRPRFFEGLLDSGADGLFIPKGIAEILELPKIEKIKTSGILKTANCFRTRVGLTIGTTKARSIEFGIIDAVFPEEETDIPILIGRNPLFKCFEVIFQEYKDRPRITIEQKKPF